MDGFPDDLNFSPLDWPAGAREPRPGDLNYFVPQGFGLGGPAIIRPYGGPPQPSYYGFHEPQVHPFRNAPTTEPAGGTLYFDDNVTGEELNAALGVLHVFGTKDYAAFARSSINPIEEHYLDQVRFVSHMALKGLFGIDGDAAMPSQNLEIPQAAAAFVAAQKAKWNDGSVYSAKLAGSAGGDGDWAKESLAFGFTVENSYWGVYRIWSRAWLVTK
jgi:hypothetical protein